MNTPKVMTLTPADADWPISLEKRQGASAPTEIQTIGPVALLRASKTAFFCSARTPGSAILRAHDTARRLRDEGVTVISGFHSPIEKDCLDILLRGKQSIVVCPARSLTGIRIPASWKQAIATGRMLLVASVPETVRRVTADSAARRNEFVAALADQIFIAHVTPGGKTEKLRNRINEWGVPLINSESDLNILGANTD